MKNTSRIYVTLLIASITLFIMSIGFNIFTVKIIASSIAVSSSKTATSPPTIAAQPSIIVATPDVEEAANALEAQVKAVYNAVSPAIVNITNRGYAIVPFTRQAIPQEGTGSGFIYDNSGHIITNYHVVEDAKELLVTLANGDVYAATLVGTDPVNDLAVLWIDADDALPAPLVLGDSTALAVGQFVVAIGNPFGLEQTLTTGVVSALGRVIESPEDSSFIGEAIQTDAAINPGNSGGPLLDLTGCVIGVNSQIVSASGTSSGVGFAVSAHTVERVVPALIAEGHYAHPWLGAQMLELTPTIAQLFREAGMNVPVDNGVLVMTTIDGGPAEKAGIQGGSKVVRIGYTQVMLGGDIITAINDETVASYQELMVYLELETTVGKTVDLTILRDGAAQHVEVTLGEDPSTMIDLE